MCRSVWKYNLKAQHDQVLELPLDSKILSVEAQDSDIVLYALVNTHQPEKERRKIAIFGTGHGINSTIDEYNFLGTVKLYVQTVKLDNEYMVFHVFYK